jgi:Protein of unknown function (DUF1706)
MAQTETMTKADVLDHLRRERANWEATLAQVDEARMMEPGVAGEWSVKDVVAHATFYVQFSADQLEAMARGETEMVLRPDTTPETQAEDMHARNAAVYSLNRDRPLREVLDDDRREYARLLVAIERLPEATLNDAQSYPWLEGAAVWRLADGNGWGHYAEHTAGIRAWLTERD